MVNLFAGADGPEAGATGRLHALRVNHGRPARRRR
jgi:hypothetical protein